MLEAGILFHLFSFLLALLSAVLLLWVNKEQEHSNRVLAWFLLICSLINLNDAILYGGWFLKIPVFHKIALPFTLLMAPLCYIYVRSVLLGELKFRRNDWLFLMPFFLYAATLVPYYLMPIEKKRAYLVEFYNNIEMQGRFDEGILPAYLFNFLRVGWSSIFIVLNFKLIRRFKRKMVGKIIIENKELLDWLSIFNWLITAVLLSSLIGAFLVTGHKITLSVTDIVLGVAVMVMCIKLFLMPKLLYGIYLPSAANTRIAEPIVSSEHLPKEKFPESSLPPQTTQPHHYTESSQTISPADSLRYKTKLETFFTRQQPFLDVNYSLEKLVSDINIPRHVLSAFINKEYGIGYREFLNRHRVSYIIENRYNPQWQLLTLKAIGEQAGFRNRTTFIRQFKAIMGITPSEYLKRPLHPNERS